MAIPDSVLLQIVTLKLPSKRPPLFSHSIPYPLSLRKSLICLPYALVSCPPPAGD